MKSFSLLALAAALAFTGCKKDDSAPVQIVTSDFDPVFAQVLQQRGYIPDANNITTTDLAAITELDVGGGEGDSPGPLTSLRGIEHFTSLMTLYCGYNLLTDIDLSQNKALSELGCSANLLTKLDVSQNPALTELSCSENHLTKLDVSQNTALMVLNCDLNQLTELDLSQNTELTELSCDYNELTELEVSANTKLTDLWCNNNQLMKLDVSDNTKLETLWCFSNQLESLDLSANTKLETLSCNNNPGNGISTFPVTVWFDNQSIPDNLEIYQGQWTYDGKTITIDFRKAE